MRDGGGAEIDTGECRRMHGFGSAKKKKDEQWGGGRAGGNKDGCVWGFWMFWSGEIMVFVFARCHPIVLMEKYFVVLMWNFTDFSA